MPNSQIYYSFIRGAGKQYGVNWFGNASVWNRWGWKSYDSNAEGIDNDYNSGGPLKGTSLGLLKRLIYTHLMYDCVAVGFEGSMRIDDKKLSPIGKIQQSAVKWVDKYGDPGVMYTPVALMTDFFSGWSFPLSHRRHSWSPDNPAHTGACLPGALHNTDSDYDKKDIPHLPSSNPPHSNYISLLFSSTY